MSDIKWKYDYSKKLIDTCKPFNLTLSPDEYLEILYYDGAINELYSLLVIAVEKRIQNLFFNYFLNIETLEEKFIVTQLLLLEKLQSFHSNWKSFFSFKKKEKREKKIKSFSFTEFVWFFEEIMNGKFEIKKYFATYYSLKINEFVDILIVLKEMRNSLFHKEPFLVFLTKPNYKFTQRLDKKWKEKFPLTTSSLDLYLKNVLIKETQLSSKVFIPFNILKSKNAIAKCRSIYGDRNVVGIGSGIYPDIVSDDLNIRGFQFVQKFNKLDLLLRQFLTIKNNSSSWIKETKKIISKDNRIQKIIKGNSHFIETVDPEKKINFYRLSFSEFLLCFLKTTPLFFDSLIHEFIGDFQMNVGLNFDKKNVDKDFFVLCYFLMYSFRNKIIHNKDNKIIDISSPLLDDFKDYFYKVKGKRNQKFQIFDFFFLFKTEYT